VTRRLRCPRCGYTRTWIIRGDKRRRARCRYDWQPGLPLRLTRNQWEALLRCHVRGLSAAAIAEETGLHRQQILRALTRVGALVEDLVAALDYHKVGKAEKDELLGVLGPMKRDIVEKR
jgi:predicted DNA-binding protein YlxM (UPF0122 family)